MRITKQNLSALLVIVLFVLSCFIGASTPQTKATTVTNTVYIYSGVSDGYIAQSANETGNNWASGHVATSGQVHSSDIGLTVGQATTGVWRGYLFFDTSGIPTTATITAATLSLYPLQDASTTDFSVTIQSDGANPHNPLISGDFFKGYYSGNYGATSSASISVGTYWNITLTDTSIINLGSQTNMTLRSSRDIAGTAPSGDEYAVFASYENSLTAKAPRLIVTYTVTGSAYTITGPYYENGNLVNGNVNVTLTYTNGFSEVYNLDGSDASADSISFSLAYTPYSFSWQTTDGANYTRLFYLGTAGSSALNLYLPSNTSEAQIYQFTISDYAGMTNPYISITKNLNGTTQLIERKPITVSVVSFVMEQWSTYNILLECDEGSYSVPFSAESSFYTNINAAPLMFDTPDTSGNFTAYSQAYNETVIRTQYADYDDTTTSLNITIFHGDGGDLTVDSSTVIANFNTTYISTQYTSDWTSRDSEENYVVFIIATRDNATYSWRYMILASTPSSPFVGIFDFLGDWPNGVDPAQVIGGVLVVFGGVAVFSYMGTAAGCAFSWIIAGILAFMGWFTISVPMFIFAGFITVLIYIDESKKTAREL